MGNFFYIFIFFIKKDLSFVVFLLIVLKFYYDLLILDIVVRVYIMVILFDIMIDNLKFILDYVCFRYFFISLKLLGNVL